MRENIQNYGAQMIVNNQELMMPGFDEYLKHRLHQMENDAIIQAVRQRNGEPIVISFKTQENKHYSLDATEYRIVIHATAVETHRVYMPILSMSEMPRNTKPCKFCGGYTHDDSRGNCAACGAPRSNDWHPRTYGIWLSE